jgi:urea carboxylase
VTGSVWSIPVNPGDRVSMGDKLVVVEAMKMEIAIEADEIGVVTEILCAQGSPVKAGQALLILQIEVS